VHHSEHSAVSLRPALRLVEANTVYCCDLIVVDRTERRDEAWYAVSPACVLVSPWAPRMKPQNAAGKIIAQF
jgi:hypothetical protein